MTEKKRGTKGPVGYCSPPVEHQFRKGTSPNPKGRPAGSGRNREPTHLYDELVPYIENGQQIQIPRGELFIRIAERRVQNGDKKFASLLLSMEEKLNRARDKSGYDQRELTGTFRRPEYRVTSINELLRRVGIAAKLYPFKSTARMALEPWAVKLALARPGVRTFTREEQEVIFSSMRYAHRVDFPSYWDPDLRGAKRAYRKR